MKAKATASNVRGKDRAFNVRNLFDGDRYSYWSTDDAVLTPDQITLETADMVASLGPFGMSNPTPVFAVRGALVEDRRVLKERHLKLRLDCCGRRLDAVGFNMAEIGTFNGPVDAAFTMDINKWNGRSNVQLKLKDIRESCGTPATNC